MSLCKTKFIAIIFACTTFSPFAMANSFMDRLQEMQSAGVPVDISVYQREAFYDKENLSFDLRAELESQKMIEQVKLRVVEAYDAAFKFHKSETAARSEVQKAISKDIALADKTVQADLKRISIDTLDSHVRGEVSPLNIDSATIKNYLKSNSVKRSAMLKHEHLAYSIDDREVPKLNREGTANEYKSKKHLVAALIDNTMNAPYPSSSTVVIKSSRATTSLQSFSAQVSMEFLGASISAGPTLNFKKSYETQATVMALGMSPNPVVLDAQGNFDFSKRDSKLRQIKVNGKTLKREISFSCTAEAKFTSEYEGLGGFKAMGVGALSSVARSYSNTVSLDSRRISVPEYVNNQSVTLNFLAEVCHNDYLNAKLANGQTTKQNLDALVKNVLASVVFSHSKTKCATDDDCIDWFNNKVISWHKVNTFPRCIQEGGAREGNFACTIQGLEKAKCAIVKEGKRTSEGAFEYPCDKGLKCVQTKKGGWFKDGELYTYDEGRCVPKDKRTYISPLTQYIEIEFAH